MRIAFAAIGMIVAVIGAFTQTLPGIWEPEQDNLAGPNLRLSRNPIYHCCVARSGEVFAYIDMSGTVRIERIPERNVVATLKLDGRHSARICFVDSGKSLIVCYTDGSITMWNSSNGRWSHRSICGKSRDRTINCCAVSSDGRYLAIGREDHIVAIWDLKNPDLLPRYLPISGTPLCLMFFPRSTELVVGTTSRSIQIWNVKSGTLRESLTGHEHYVSAVSVSSDQTMILSGDWCGVVRLWNRKTGRNLWSVRINKHRRAILSLAMSPDGRKFAVASYGAGQIEIRESATGHLLRVISAHRTNISGIHFLSDGTLISTGHDGAVQHFSVEDLR